MAGVCAPRPPTAALLPSPPNSPPPSSRAPSPQPSQSSDGFLQLALKGVVKEYVPPDHRWGESFPGKQPATQQLSLFEAGVKKVPPKVSRRRA